VQAGDTIRHDAVQLLENPDAAVHASAAIEVDLALAVEPCRRRRSGGPRYRAHVVIYRAAEP